MNLIKSANDTANTPALLTDTRLGTGHFAFRRIHLYLPACKRIRLRFNFWKIDEQLFVRSVVQPYPEWPLICKTTLHYAFDTETNAKQWVDKTNGSIYNSWKCEYCAKWHYLSFPLEVSGTSSGKSLRKLTFFKKYDPKHYQELLLETKYGTYDEDAND